MNELTETTIEADRTLPIVRVARDFTATPAQLLRAHTDPELFVRWVGPDALTTRVDRWDARTGGSWRYVSVDGDTEHWFHGSFHEIGPSRLVQTFTYEGAPDGVALETVWFEDLGGGRTRLRSQSLVDSFDARDAILRSGMEVGVTEGYAKLERMLDDGAV
ncbi:SRPBCC family protein [Actinocatenispora comari]|uniref:Activator of HSP90 ATPase n=1 Tax=Actinocatenispora comari TaxID=2807577 RepID=A0A8J4AH36_9ACTN|nr:SRPBCC family protein [Actinocatenispora comari]GIL28578.1 activator of HSP90 ATPase [Actinocatenispora comari]